MTPKINRCNAAPSSVTIFFSDALDNSAGAVEDPKNYSIQRMGIDQGPASAFVLNGKASVTYDQIRHTAVVTAVPGTSGARSPWPNLTKGQWIAVTVLNLKNAAGQSFAHGDDTYPVQVNGDDDLHRNAEKTTRAVEDAVAYPVLTEEIGFSGAPTTARSGRASGPPGTGSLGQMVTQAVGDVLGWKVRTDDAKGFVGALNASFTLTTFEGHTDATWTPRTYAVQTDLSGGISGAQASIYTRAQGALDQSLPLLDGLYTLDPETDEEDIVALKAVAGNQLRELVGELPRPGGPRVPRVNQYFQLLLGQDFPPPTGVAFQTDPDAIAGTLGTLRDQLGLNFTTQDFVNTLDDEQNLSNFRIMADYVTSLAQSWINNLRFFGLDTATPFFGTQLVLLSRQLSVVAETVDEVRFTLDSVFIGPAERQTLELRFAPPDKPLFAEDLFNWIGDFSCTEGPRLVQDGGKFGVQNTFLPIASKLLRLVKGAEDPNPFNRHLPRGFHTTRVQRALRELADQLQELVDLAEPITHDIVAEPTKADLNMIREEVAVLTEEVGTLKITRPSLVAFPPSLTFPSQRVGTTSPPQVVTFFNSGVQQVTISSIAVDPAGDFDVLEPTPPIALAPGATLAVSIDFEPARAGARTATLTASYSIPSTGAATLEVSISGTGVTRRTR